ncbi:MAG: hypothetical protein ACOZD0_04480 [Pseudomonadota bacterium]
MSTPPLTTLDDLLARLPQAGELSALADQPPRYFAYLGSVHDASWEGDVRTRVTARVDMPDSPGRLIRSGDRVLLDMCSDGAGMEMRTTAALDPRSAREVAAHLLIAAAACEAQQVGMAISGLIAAAGTAPALDQQDVDAQAGQAQASQLPGHTPEAHAAMVSGDLVHADHAGLQRMVHPLPDSMSRGAQPDQDHRAVGQLQRNGEPKHEHGDTDHDQGLVPNVNGQPLQVTHDAPSLCLDSLDAPGLAGALAAAQDGSGPPVTLVGMDVELVHAKGGAQ